MQTQAPIMKSQKGGSRLGAGRPVGSKKTPASVKKAAILTLERIMRDESASPEARTMAACKLLDESKA